MYKILIVDDERREREGLKRLIERYKYPLEVYTAEDGEEALQYFWKNGNRYSADRYKNAFYDRN